MSAHERFLLAEAKQRVKEGERRARLEQGLAELKGLTLRHRAAEVLVALAHRLSPELVLPPKHTLDSPCAERSLRA
jgi:hypothetical protein